MQTDLSYLPDRKRRELAEIVRLIRGAVDVELIILYGSYARGDWKEVEHLDPDRWSGHVSDYDILIVVAERAQAEDVLLWKRVSESLNEASFSAQVRPIVHDVNEVNMALMEGRYFFQDLYNEGRLLYNTGRFQLAEPDELRPETRKRLVEEYFETWYERASGFYEGYEFYRGKGNLNLAAFNLNQATEAAYKTITLVFTLYCPHEHMLEILGRMASNHGPVFDEIFAQSDAQQRHCFEQLDRAYIGSRYHPRFKVTLKELDYLAPRVRALLQVTKQLCQEEIARYDSKDA